MRKIITAIILLMILTVLGCAQQQPAPDTGETEDTSTGLTDEQEIENMADENWVDPESEVDIGDMI
ncbi:hypothetical protein GF323_04770 [Candidatus Woesearchaeota archaeon]|nr:hypothetical protein [Candidatus Woesearchaeota archaeon]